MNKVAFLFLVYEEINNNELWNKFFEGVDMNKYSIYIHCKYRNFCKYFEGCKLKESIETSYGDISLVYAEKLLLKEAYKDSLNKKFVFLSQSCIPLKGFYYVYSHLMSNDYSYFDISKDSQCFPRCDSVLEFMDKSNIKKASQWMVLDRQDVEICLKDDEIINYFKGVFAPEEHYFITLIHMKNKNNIINEAITYVDWSNPDNDCSPRNFTFIDENELINLFKSKFLFARKFDKNCYIRKPLSFINF